MKKFYITALFLSIFTSPSFAYDGNTLLEYSKSWERIENQSSTVVLKDSMSSGLFMGYVLGVSDVLKGKNIVMLPPNTSRKQIILIVKQYLENHPQYLHLGGRFIIESALNRAFPRFSPKPLR